MNDVIWETDELKATLYHDDALIYLKDVCGDMIGCSVDELTAFARHWLGLQGEGNKYKDALEKILALIEDYDGRDDTESDYYTDSEILHEKISDVLDEALNTITKCKLEIAPCPVCGGNVHYNNNDEWADISSNIFCADCNGVSLTYPSFALAVKAWNALPRKGEK
jgi:hypothetical protein